MPSVLRQPLLHFIIVGAAFFALFALVDDTPPTPDRPEIVVSLQDATWLAGQYEATWKRPPSADELDTLIDAFVREEVYVREALALGLDQGDTIVRRRLQQKMEFLTEAGAQAMEVDDAVLDAFYSERAEAFTSASRIAFVQILLVDDRPETTAGVLADLAAGADPRSLGRRTLLPSAIPLAPKQSVDGTFGAGFFEQVAALNAGAWSGPVVSGYGAHLIRLDSFEPGELPPLSAVRDRVELEWRAQQAADLRAARFELLRDQYAITRPDPADVLSQ